MDEAIWAKVSPLVTVITVAVPPTVRVKESAPRPVVLEGTEGEAQDVEVEGAEVMEKSAAAPEAVLMMARRAPVESLTTVAVTPRFCELRLAATSLRVLMPLPVVMVAVAPALVVSVKEDAGRTAVALVARSEYHEAVLARWATATV